MLNEDSSAQSNFNGYKQLNYTKIYKMSMNVNICYFECTLLPENKTYIFLEQAIGG